MLRTRRSRSPPAAITVIRSGRRAQGQLARRDQPGAPPCAACVGAARRTSAARGARRAAPRAGDRVGLRALGRGFSSNRRPEAPPESFPAGGTPRPTTQCSAGRLPLGARNRSGPGREHPLHQPPRPAASHPAAESGAWAIGTWPSPVVGVSAAASEPPCDCRPGTAAGGWQLRKRMTERLTAPGCSRRSEPVRRPRFAASPLATTNGSPPVEHPTPRGRGRAARAQTARRAAAEAGRIRVRSTGRPAARVQLGAGLPRYAPAAKARSLPGLPPAAPARHSKACRQRRPRGRPGHGQ